MKCPMIFATVFMVGLALAKLGRTNARGPCARVRAAYMV